MREDADHRRCGTGGTALHPVRHVVVVLDEQHFSLRPRRPDLIGPLLGDFLGCRHQHRQCRGTQQFRCDNPVGTPMPVRDDLPALLVIDRLYP